MHAQTNPLQRVYDCVRCACANSRTRHTKTRLEATLPFRTLEMQLQFSLHAGLFTSGGMLPSAKAPCICTSYTFKVYALAITLLRHAHAHMHALHNVHMRVPYGIEFLPKTRASLMQHCMVAASRVDPWPKSWCSAQQQTARCIHTYPPPTGDRYHVHVSKVEFLRAAGEKFGNWEVKRSIFSEKMAIRTT